MRRFAHSTVVTVRHRLQWFSGLVVLLWFGGISTTYAQLDPTRALLLASARGDVAAIAGLVAQGANVNARLNPDTGEIQTEGKGIEWSSGLVISVYCGCIDVTRALISAGAQPQLGDLFYAIELNQYSIAQVILSSMKPLAANDGGQLFAFLTERMPPETAAQVRHLMTRQIIDGHVDSEGVAAVGPILGVVAFTRDPNDEIFALLDALSALGYAIDAPSGGYDDGPRSAREIASRNGDVLLARRFALRGAKLPKEWTQEREKEIQIVGAARSGNEAGLALLLNEGVSVNARDVDGNYALAAALEHHNLEIAIKLLDAGSSPGLFASKQSSPLSSAARMDQAGLIAGLVGKGALVDQLDGTGAFPLREAAREGATHAIAELLVRGASPLFTDELQRTALHNLIDSDQIPWGGGKQNRSLNPLHLEAVRLLVSAGLPLNALNSEQDTVLSSNFGHGNANLDLIRTFVTVGARANVSDISRALRLQSADLLRVLLRNRIAGVLPSDLLVQAVAHINEAPDLAVAFLDEGVLLPGDQSQQQQQLLRQAARAQTPTVLGLLLSRGVPLSVDPRSDALEDALYEGRTKNVALLVACGVDIYAKDGSGRTALHRLIASDARGTRPSRIGTSQREAITALIDAGFALSTFDGDGKTVIALAQSKASTLVAFNQALAAAGAKTAGLHGAIRKSSYDEVRRLAASPELRESKDSLGRTPLSLALQMKNWPAARILLRAGSRISLWPTQVWLPADTDFAGEREIAGAFAVRLLSTTLIDIPTDRNPERLKVARQAYRDGRALPFADFTWHVLCQATATKCDESMAGNKKTLLDYIESFRIDREAKTSFGLIQRNLRSVHIKAPIDLGRGPFLMDFGEVTFLLNGSIAIQACSFDYAHPSCSPGVRISNPNTASGLSMITDTGYEDLPIANLHYVQAGGVSGLIKPGETLVLDRSDGAISLALEQVKARVFSLRVELERIPGEEALPLPPDPSTANRMALYVRLAQLLDKQKSLRSTWTGAPPFPADRAADKTIAATVAALSDEAWIAGYPTVVLVLLRQQAEVVANLDVQVRAIQNAVLAQATYTPDQIDVLVAQIDAKLGNPGVGDTAMLRLIRAELLRLRASAQATGTAVNELRDTLVTDADHSIELYQALVLEYRQYVPSEALSGALDDQVRQAIAARVSGREVLIVDAAADGTGKALRKSFGLPEPKL